MARRPGPSLTALRIPTDDAYDEEDDFAGRTPVVQAELPPMPSSPTTTPPESPSHHKRSRRKSSRERRRSRHRRSSTSDDRKSKKRSKSKSRDRKKSRKHRKHRKSGVIDRNAPSPADLRLDAVTWSASRFWAAHRASRVCLAPTDMTKEMCECLCNDPVLAPVLFRAAKRLPVAAKHFAEQPRRIVSLLDALESARSDVRRLAAETLLFVTLGCPQLRNLDAPAQMSGLNSAEPGYMPVAVKESAAELACKAMNAAGALPILVGYFLMTTSRHNIRDPTPSTLSATHTAFALLHCFLASCSADDLFHIKFASFMDVTQFNLMRHVAGLLSLSTEAGVWFPVRKASLLLRRILLLLMRSIAETGGGGAPVIAAAGAGGTTAAAAAPSESTSRRVSSLPRTGLPEAPSGLGKPTSPQEASPSATDMDLAYVLLLPHIESLLAAMLELLTAAAPTLKEYVGSVHLHRELVGYDDSADEPPESVKNLHSEIVAYAAAHTLILLLKWWRHNHPMQGEYASIILLNRHAPALFMKYMSQDLGAYLASPSSSWQRLAVTPTDSGDELEDDDVQSPLQVDEVPLEPGAGGGGVVDTPRPTLEVPPHAMAGVPTLVDHDVYDSVSSSEEEEEEEEEDYPFCDYPQPSTLNLRRCGILYSLLRVLHRIVKGHPERIQEHMVKNRTASVLLRGLDAHFVPVTLSSLKLIKIQVRYFGAVWRRSHMTIVSAIYRLVPLQLRDNWLIHPDHEASVKVFAETATAPPTEDALRRQVDVYNRRCHVYLTAASTGAPVPVPCLPVHAAAQITAKASGEVLPSPMPSSEGVAVDIPPEYAAVWERVCSMSSATTEELDLPPWFTGNYKAWLDVELPLGEGMRW